MAILKEINFAELDSFLLDASNPRLGRNYRDSNLSQDDVLDLMSNSKLDELATSYLASGGFWTQEALIVVKEKIKGKNKLVVVEGNRRLAALILLKRTFDKKNDDITWQELIKRQKKPINLFKEIPYIEAESRKDVIEYLGFRHVTGIKQWKPPEKAEYISKLIDSGLSYIEVKRKIGSTKSAVRNHYITYKLLLQIEENVDEIPLEYIEGRFSVMMNTLRTAGVREYLNIDMNAQPKKAKHPIPKSKLNNLKKYSMWLFGDEDIEPLFRDSRLVDKFGQILENKKAVAYLERQESPEFEVAYKMAGGEEPDIVNLLLEAADNLELAMGKVHFYKKSKNIKKALERLFIDMDELTSKFPTLYKKLKN